MSDRPTETPPPPDRPTGLPPMPLERATIGQEVILAEIRGGKRFQHRMAEMGLAPGSRFRILNKSNPGPCIVAIKETRMVIGHGMMHRVYVYPA